LLLALGVVPLAAQAPMQTTPATADQCITLEDFARAKVGEFPPDWKPRKDAGKSVYRVVEEKGLRFLRAASTGLGIQAAKQHEWVEERVNALADYKKSFGESETPKPAGIAVLTDSDDTKSSAQGDYANFRACRG